MPSGKLTIRTLERIDDKDHVVSLKKGIAVELPKMLAERLIHEGKAERSPSSEPGKKKK